MGITRILTHTEILWLLSDDMRQTAFCVVSGTQTASTQQIVTIIRIRLSSAAFTVTLILHSKSQEDRGDTVLQRRQESLSSHIRVCVKCFLSSCGAACGGQSHLNSQKNHALDTNSPFCAQTSFG